MIVCSKCKVNKAFDEFYNDKSKLDGLTCTCKECINKQQREYDESNKELISSYHIVYGQLNKDKIDERSRLWYLDNSSSLKERRDVNKVNKRVCDKEYYERNKDVLLHKKRDYQHSDKGKLSKRMSNAKRRRNLGYNEIFNNPFPKDISVHGHHISSEFVLYIPVELHMKHLHGTNTKLHIDELKPIIEKMYNISYIIEEK